MTRGVDLLGLTHLTFGTLTFIERASKGPSFDLYLLFTVRSDTFKVVWLLTAGVKDLFQAVNAVSENNIVVSQKLLFDANLVLGLFIAYEALPTKGIRGICMQIGVQFNCFTCHSKITNNRVTFQVGHPFNH